MVRPFSMITLPTPVTIQPDPGVNDEGPDGPSWGLIIPIIMIALFLLCVGLCLWYQKWRDKILRRRRRDGNVTGLSFQRRRYFGVRTENAFDAVRDSTRSTTPLDCNANQNMTHHHNNVIKVNNVNVIPLYRARAPCQRSASGKYYYNWDNNQWKPYQMSVTPCADRLRGRLSPINEIDSPTSAALSDLSKNYDIPAHPPYSPYHLTWLTTPNPNSCEKSQKMTGSVSESHNQNRTNGCNRSTSGLGQGPVSDKSPFCPNHNTPTTDCDLESDVSVYPQSRRETTASGSRFGSLPSGTASNAVLSVKDAHLTLSTETDGNCTFLTTSYPESSFPTSSFTSPSSNGYNNPSFSPTESMAFATPASSRELSSLASSIAMFSKQNAHLMDPNNNNLAVPMSHVSFPMARALNYTLASSIESSDTQFSDNTSMAPNVGSSISGYPTTITSRSLPDSAGRSRAVSPDNAEDLSKLVDEFSSIRPVDESSGAHPNVCADSHTSGHSGERPRSWNNPGDAEHVSVASMARSSQTNSNTDDSSYYWDNYPLNSRPAITRSYPDLLHVPSQNILGRGLLLNPNRNIHAPVLMNKQYWV